MGRTTLVSERDYSRVRFNRVSAVVNATDYTLSNFDRIELHGKEGSSLHIKLDIELHMSLIAPRYNRSCVIHKMENCLQMKLTRIKESSYR